MEHGPSNAFAVVADPSRRALLDSLRLGPRDVGSLVGATGLSQPTTSRHLRVLREAGLVSCRAVGRRRIYELRPQGFTALADWLTPYVLLLGEGSGERSEARRSTPSRDTAPRPASAGPGR